MLQRKLLLKPCFKFLKSSNNLLKQGFNLAKHNNVKTKQYKRAIKRRSILIKSSLKFAEILP